MFFRSFIFIAFVLIVMQCNSVFGWDSEIINIALFLCIKTFNRSENWPQNRHNLVSYNRCFSSYNNLTVFSIVLKITETPSVATTAGSDKTTTTSVSPTNTTTTPIPPDDCKKPTTCFEFIFEGFKLGALTYVILILSIKVAKLCAKIMGVGVVFCGLVGLLIGCLVAAAIVVFLVVDHNTMITSARDTQKQTFNSNWKDINELFENFCRECIPFLDSWCESTWIIRFEMRNFIISVPFTNNYLKIEFLKFWWKFIIISNSNRTSLE